eukprot:6558419-Pyramimonas_sp.AAC.1
MMTGVRQTNTWPAYCMVGLMPNSAPSMRICNSFLVLMMKSGPCISSNSTALRTPRWYACRFGSWAVITSTTR